MGRAVFAALIVSLVACARGRPGPDVSLRGHPDVPYLLDIPVESRSISFENPTGAGGAGGKAASKLGPGRKGSPSLDVKPGETVTL